MTQCNYINPCDQTQCPNPVDGNNQFCTQKCEDMMKGAIKALMIPQVPNHTVEPRYIAFRDQNRQFLEDYVSLGGKDQYLHDMRFEWSKRGSLTSDQSIAVRRNRERWTRTGLTLAEYISKERVTNEPPLLPRCSPSQDDTVPAEVLREFQRKNIDKLSRKIQADRNKRKIERNETDQ